MEHEIFRVFFYQEGVYHAFKYSTPPDDELRRRSESIEWLRDAEAIAFHDFSSQGWADRNGTGLLANVHAQVAVLRKRNLAAEWLAAVEDLSLADRHPLSPQEHVVGYLTMVGSD